MPPANFYRKRELNGAAVNFGERNKGSLELGVNLQTEETRSIFENVVSILMNNTRFTSKCLNTFWLGFREHPSTDWSMN